MLTTLSLLILAACTPPTTTDPLPITRLVATPAPTIEIPSTNTPSATAASPASDTNETGTTHTFQPGDPTLTPPGDNITDATFVQGREAYWNRNYARVIPLMDEIITQDPNLAPAYWYRGKAYAQLGDFQTGLVDINKAIELDPLYASAHADRGWIYANLGDRQKAMDNFEYALSLDPSLAKVHHNMGRNYYELGNYEQALFHYAQEVAIDPHRRLGWQDLVIINHDLANYQQCATTAAEAVAIHPDLFDVIATQGDCHRHLGQYDEAKQILDDLLQQNPNHANGYYQRARVTAELNYFDAAIADYTKTLTLQPDHLNAYIYRSTLYVQTNQYQLAITELDQILAFTNDPLALVTRGRAHQHLQQYDRAIADYEAALNQTKAPLAYVGLAEIALQQEDYEKAATLLENGINGPSSQKDYAFLLATRGQLHLQQANYPAAIEDLSTAIEIHPISIYHYHRGLAYQANNQPTLALDDYNAFINTINPFAADYPAAQLNALIDDAVARKQQLQ